MILLRVTETTLELDADITTMWASILAKIPLDECGMDLKTDLSTCINGILSGRPLEGYWDQRQLHTGALLVLDDIDRRMISQALVERWGRQSWIFTSTLDHISKHKCQVWTEPGDWTCLDQLLVSKTRCINHPTLNIPL